MIRVSPPELRVVAGEQEQQARLLAGLLADIAAPLRIATAFAGSDQTFVAVRMAEIVHVVEALGANHAAVARGLRQAADVYDGVDHPHATAAAKMVLWR